MAYSRALNQKENFFLITYTSDFKVKSFKVIKENFCLQGPNFKRKFETVLDFLFKESNKNTPIF